MSTQDEMSITEAEDYTISQALAILEKRMRNRKPRAAFACPNDAKRYLRLHYAGKEHEEFNVLYLNSYGGLIANETMFRGTLDQAAVYPREVAKTALKHNAASVVLAHNHPEGINKPSQPDNEMTKRMMAALALVGVHVLDHMVVGTNGVHSYAEAGTMHRYHEALSGHFGA